MATFKYTMSLLMIICIGTMLINATKAGEYDLYMLYNNYINIMYFNQRGK